jgi:hypothetical protein
MWRMAAASAGSADRCGFFEPDTSLYVPEVTADLVRDVLPQGN